MLTEGGTDHELVLAVLWRRATCSIHFTEHSVHAFAKFLYQLVRTHVLEQRSPQTQPAHLLERLPLYSFGHGRFLSDRFRLAGRQRADKLLRGLRHDIRYAAELVLDVFNRGNLGLGFLEVETAGVVGVELVDGDGFDVAFGEVFVVIEGAVVDCTVQKKPVLYARSRYLLIIRISSLNPTVNA